MALIDELKQQRAEMDEKYHRAIADGGYYCGRLNDLDRAIAALEAPAQPVHPDAELRSVTPATEEESGDQFEPDASPAEDFTLLDPALLSIDEPILDATILPQVTPDEVPPTAEVIHTDDGRKRFALFGGQTHEVVSGSGNPDADFWASVLHPKPKVDA